MPDQPARHTLVWLSAQADWRADVPAHDPRLSAWFARGWPAVVARRAADDPDPRVRLGVPLPPAEGKQRLGLRVSLDDIARQAPPLALGHVRGHARVPDAWRAPLAALDAVAPARVFGAFAWQVLTGLDYVHARSDVDLLWSVHDARSAEALVGALQGWEARFGLRVDGELCLPGGAAVNWREMAGGSRQVLVKRVDGAGLEERSALFDHCSRDPHGPSLHRAAAVVGVAL
jgi:phosphoribosyl-dephospho-CoA transferase